jgi:hypothetical protein
MLEVDATHALPVNLDRRGGHTHGLYCGEEGSVSPFRYEDHLAGVAQCNERLVDSACRVFSPQPSREVGVGGAPVGVPSMNEGRPI